MKKKLFLTALFLTLNIVPLGIPAVSATVKAATTEGPDIQLYNEDKGYRYKIINGKLHRRLWSYKENKWLEPDWTPVS